MRSTASFAYHLTLWSLEAGSITGLAVSNNPSVSDCAPNFEKILYDNSKSARVYLHAWQVTGNEFFRSITQEILNYVMREVIDPAGVQMLRMQHLPSSPSGAGIAGFYSTQDADSEGEEGKFLVWTPAEIRQVLGGEADAFITAYGVTRHGDASTGSAHGFEGMNTLEFVGDLDQHPALVEARRRLFEAREQPVHPGRDDVQLAREPTAKQCRKHCRILRHQRRP